MAPGSEAGGCLHCYAARLAARNLPAHRSPTTGEPFAIMRSNGPRWTGRVELIPSKLDEPLRWRKPRRVFVNSMSDLFHEGLSDEAIDKVFAVMALAPEHTYQILTKRPGRMRDYLTAGFVANRIVDQMRAVAPSRAVWTWPGWDEAFRNVWLGVSVEDQATADERIPLLLQTPAAVRFVSYEPALGPVDFLYPATLWPDGPATCCNGMECGCRGLPIDPPLIHGLDWLIVGGESGPGARPFDVSWARSAIRQCREAGVACFVKQLGARPTTGPTGRFRTHRGERQFELVGLRLKSAKGGDPLEWSPDLRVREFPR